MTTPPSSSHGSVAEVFGAFLVLGLTAFGGPIAHLGYFHDAFVRRRRWLDEAAYADLVALCQALPGPASSQVGFCLGILRSGSLLGGLAAWAAFTLPSACLLAAFALGAGRLGGPVWSGVVHGLKLVAVAVVAQAVWGMARTLAPDRTRAAIALGALALATLPLGAPAQVAAIALGGLAGLALCRDGAAPGSGSLRPPVSRRAGGVAIGLCLLLLGAPLLASVSQDFLIASRDFSIASRDFPIASRDFPIASRDFPIASRDFPIASRGVAVFDAFYRSGALVFGGGHVVLPLLRTAVVETGWVTPDAFLAGYGAAQAVPGPLFTVAAYLGALAMPGGLAGAAIALVAIFLPGLLLAYGALPFWDALRVRPAARAALRGSNAAVVGLLAAALYDPVWTGAITGPRDVALAAAAFLLLTLWAAPPWLVVALTTCGGVGLALAGG